MIVLDADRIESLLPMEQLVEALHRAFATEVRAYERTQVPVPGGGDERLLLTMPAFGPDGSGVVKLATVFPGNRDAGLPTIQGALLIFDALGRPTALLDAAAVTRRRTAAASALASRFLSRRDSRRLLIIGTGSLAPYLALAHSTVRSIEAIEVWGRNPARSGDTAEAIGRLVPSGINISTVEGLDAAVANADIISCSTSTADPILKGAWLRPGSFVDLVGSFSPLKRECDDDTVRRSTIYVDTIEGAMAEAGDLLQPINRGLITPSDVRGGLADLVSGRAPGRTCDAEITLFKSVGSSIEDYAAAQDALQRFVSQIHRG